MSFSIAAIIITFIVCVTIVVYRMIDLHFEKLKEVDNYWRGRYATLWDIFDKAVKYDLSDDMMHDIEHIIENNQ